jgi:hypothetical protein
MENGNRSYQIFIGIGNYTAIMPKFGGMGEILCKES